VVIDGWILLQVARRVDSPDSGSTSGKSGIASDAAQVQLQPAVDYQLARRKGKSFFLAISINRLRFLVSLIVVMCALYVSACLLGFADIEPFFYSFLQRKKVLWMS